MRKQIAESRNLFNQAVELAEYIKSVDEFITPKPARVFRRDKTPGGYRIPIEKPFRVAAQKRYRAKVGAQLRKAVSNLNDDVIIEDISYCEMADWRW